jgi:hypothetical protein
MLEALRVPAACSPVQNTVTRPSRAQRSSLPDKPHTKKHLRSQKKNRPVRRSGRSARRAARFSKRKIPVVPVWGGLQFQVPGAGCTPGWAPPPDPPFRLRHAGRGKAVFRIGLQAPEGSASSIGFSDHRRLLLISAPLPKKCEPPAVLRSLPPALRGCGAGVRPLKRPAAPRARPRRAATPGRALEFHAPCPPLSVAVLDWPDTDRASNSGRVGGWWGAGWMRASGARCRAAALRGYRIPASIMKMRWRLAGSACGRDCVAGYGKQIIAEGAAAHEHSSAEHASTQPGCPHAGRTFAAPPTGSMCHGI